MEPEELFDQVEKVNSRETFLAFLQSLERDFELSREQERKAPNLSEPAARGWYSASISDFLGAMRAWAVDNRIPDQATWRLSADMLHNGKLYE
jgi:hypothetical protein